MSQASSNMSNFELPKSIILSRLDKESKFSINLISLRHFFQRLHPTTGHVSRHTLMVRQNILKYLFPHFFLVLHTKECIIFCCCLKQMMALVRWPSQRWSSHSTRTGLSAPWHRVSAERSKVAPQHLKNQKCLLPLPTCNQVCFYLVRWWEVPCGWSCQYRRSLDGRCWWPDLSGRCRCRRSFAGFEWGRSPPPWILHSNCWGSPAQSGCLLVPPCDKNVDFNQNTDHNQ